MMPSLPRVPLTPRDLGGLAHLLFEWPIRQAPRLSLPLCILLAAIVQGFMIFLFSISYKAPSSPRPESPQVYFLPPDSKAANRLIPWLEANDPAVFSPQRAAGEALPAPPPLNYRPSYMEPPPPLRALPPEELPALQPPPLPVDAGVSGGLVGLGRKAVRAPAASSHAADPKAETVVHWEDDLSGRVLVTPELLHGLPNPSAFPHGRGAQEPSLYQVAVNEEGIPAHNVLIGTSGDATSDEAGRIWIQSARFQPSDHVTWGRVIIIWGAGTKDVGTKGSGGRPVNSK